MVSQRTRKSAACPQNFLVGAKFDKYDVSSMEFQYLNFSSENRNITPEMTSFQETTWLNLNVIVEKGKY